MVPCTLFQRALQPRKWLNDPQTFLYESKRKDETSGVNFDGAIAVGDKVADRWTIRGTQGGAKL